MQEILDHMSPVELGGMLVVAGLVAGGLIFSLTKAATLILSRAGSIRVGTVHLGSDQAKGEPCINSVKFLMVLAKQAEYINLRRDIKSSVMPDQMRFAESVSTEIRGMLLKAFIAAANSEMERTGSDLPAMESYDYHIYRLCIRIMHEDMRDWIREAFRENHFNEKSQIDFERYVETKIADGLQVATEVIDDLYRGKTIPRARIGQENAKIMGELKAKIASIFKEARKIAIDAEAAIERARIEYETFLAEQTKESL